MTAENSAEPDGNRENIERRQVLHNQIEFLWQALKETADLLMKAIAFFLTVVAAILGYVLSHPVNPSFRTIAFRLIIIITTLFSIAVASVAWGLWTGVRDLESAQEQLSPDVFTALRMNRFFSRARFVFWTIIATSLLILVILLSAIGRALVA
jgi:hypothetical protein